MAFVLSITACAQEPSQPRDFAEPPVSTDSADQLLRLGDYVKSQGNQPMAIALYQQVVNIDDVETPVLLKAADTLKAEQALEPAARAYTKALQAEPENLVALEGLVGVLLELGRLEDSVPVLEMTIGVEPDEIANYRRLGAVLDLLGRHEQAGQVYRTALASFGDDPDLMSNYALSLALDGEFDEATRVVEETIKLANTDRQHQRNAVLIFAMSGENVKAERFGSDVGLSETNSIIDQAKILVAIQDSAERAKILGAAPAGQL